MKEEDQKWKKIGSYLFLALCVWRGGGGRQNNDKNKRGLWGQKPKILDKLR